MLAEEEEKGMGSGVACLQSLLSYCIHILCVFVCACCSGAHEVSAAEPAVVVEPDSDGEATGTGATDPKTNVSGLTEV